MKNIQWKPLIVSLLFSVGIGVLGGIISSGSMRQYETLYHPPLSPPGWIFPVAWTILYILMGIAAYLVYISESEEKNQALKLYVIQLAINFAWPILFFELQAYLLAFAWLLLLWYVIWLTAKSFYQINKSAGILMLPYLIWVTFAGYLNLAIAIHYMS